MEARQGPPRDVSREHLANERTHLAWVRTAISMLSFGIAINRFSLYLREIHAVPVEASRLWPLADTARAGLALVVLGILMMVGSSARFVSVGRAIDRGSYRPATRSTLLVTGAIVIASLGLLWLFRRS